MTITLEDVRAAAARIAGHLPRTPTVPAPRLGDMADCRMHVKLENQHATSSFKERGALNKLLSLGEAERRAGVIAMSAGNHAQAVACHATRLGIRSTIVMPAFTPFTKVERTENLGATVELHGETLSEAAAFAHELAARDGLTFVHPYDDPLVAAGQGTAALELLEDVPDLDVLVVPIGGGGLISGMATAAKALRPDLEIVGVQCSLYPAVRQALAGQPITCGGATVAEGIAVKAPGALTLPIIRAMVDDVVEVGEARLEEAVYRLATVQKLVAEGAGAAALAAVLDDPQRYRGRKVGIVLSGGNIDSRIMAQVLMRGLVYEGRIVRLRISITDAPGALARVTRLLGEAGANIVEVHHQRLFHNVPVKMAEVDVVLETRNQTHVDALIARMKDAGYPTSLMMEVG
ncbi:threonine ammonia-lyase [Azospirillum melinis]|uniref:Threonine ammonia-lyase n=1 Tax=Azospirillum melinis TaxID=328839 RepID=A0ABX2KKV9_9PROT|nr:threonine ammonia-lyase [Azospirillum melinis]MBP2304318.1 threonine dehydratase [Azospirillum melinis]NUB03366.1 threonine ammonia-lyase [Azospirillum melinis]